MAALGGFWPLRENRARQLDASGDTCRRRDHRYRQNRYRRSADRLRSDPSPTRSTNCSRKAQEDGARPLCAALALQGVIDFLTL
jgi:hypothetical protein